MTRGRRLPSSAVRFPTLRLEHPREEIGERTIDSVARRLEPEVATVVELQLQPSDRRNRRARSSELVVGPPRVRVPEWEVAKKVARPCTNERLGVDIRIAEQSAGSQSVAKRFGRRDLGVAQTATSVLTKSWTRSSGGGAGARPAGWKPGDDAGV